MWGDAGSNARRNLGAGAALGRPTSVDGRATARLSATLGKRLAACVLAVGVSGCALWEGSEERPKAETSVPTAIASVQIDPRAARDPAPPPAPAQGIETADLPDHSRLRGATAIGSPLAKTPEAPRLDAARSPVIFRGSGDFLNSTVEPDYGPHDGGDITLNFVDAEIAEVLQRILGDILEENYVMDEAVTGTITIQTASPVSRDSLLPILDDVLRAKGVTLVKTNGHFRVENVASAARAGLTPLVGRRSDAVLGFGVVAAPLQYVSVKEMANILRPIVRDGAVLRVDQARNMLLLSGSPRELAQMQETIRIFDVDWLSGNSFALVPAETADAAELAQELETVFGTETEGPLDGLVRFVPVERLNSILVMSPQPEYVSRAVEWVRRLDVSSPGPADQFYTYQVQNRAATELVALLQSVFSQRDSAGFVGVAPGFTPATASSIGSDDGDSNDGDDVELTPVAARAPIGGVLSDLEGLSSLSTDDIRVFADDGTNSLVIIASQSNYERALRIIKQLDQIPKQVLLEATIAEVALTDELEFGVQWFLRGGEFTASFAQSATDTGRAAIGSIFPGFSALLNTTDIDVALNAIASVTDVNVISSPSLMVLDNKTATLQVGDEVPVVTQTVQSVGNSTPDATTTSNSVTQRDTGVILKVTPRVNDGGLVLLSIEQEVSDVVETTSSGIDSPTFQERKVETSVAVQDGETLVLGGLIRDRDTVTSSGVPFISRVPVFGNLFKSQDNNFARTELLILITPRVVQDLTEARAVTDELRQRLRAVEPLGARIE